MKKTLILCVAVTSLAVGLSLAAENPYAGKFFASGDPKKAEFALTFDDGPGHITEALLALLEKRGAKAAFFIPGSSARAYPARVKKIAEAGHLVASHTDTHKNWFKIGNAGNRETVLEAELARASEAIQKAGGQRPTVLRMPNGYDRPWVRAVARRLNYTLVNWTYGSDWLKQPEEKMTAEYLKALKPGAILLLHDGGGKVKEKNLRLVAALLDEAGKRGLKPVRLDDLLGLGAPGAKR
ncbi:MAG: hypothetical protein A2X35_03040 [Elusimicrobia bacterium GWA2_61_42]|nr:MAG: hypothetical protein A2X35_03040 [Elusimicrobia bacterium GWA2_61_42]OGR74785.1 MAG: hypothetical protein A2X38_08455 [Elusimicrobia bacterium GWC2_61_25]